MRILVERNAADPRSTATARAGWWLLAAVLVTLTVGGGCTKQHGQNGAEPPLVAVPANLTYTDMVLPLDAYLPSAQTQALWQQAGEVLTRDCMRRYGLDWPSRPAVVSARPRHDRRYGIADLRQAQAYGYRVPVEPDAKAEPAEASEPGVSAAVPRPVQLTEDQRAVAEGRVKSLHGIAVPEGGCLELAQRALTAGAPDVGSAASGTALPLELEGGLTGRIERDSRLRKVWADWSACMAARGFRYRDPWAANDDPRWSGATAPDLEIATATADVYCRQETNLIGVWYAVEAAYQEQVISGYGERLAAWKAAIEANTANATRILSGR